MRSQLGISEVLWSDTQPEMGARATLAANISVPIRPGSDARSRSAHVAVYLADEILAKPCRATGVRAEYGVPICGEKGADINICPCVLEARDRSAVTMHYERIGSSTQLGRRRKPWISTPSGAFQVTVRPSPSSDLSQIFPESTKE
ncbi:hypothetical protein RJZ57_001279 [Blastomyces gilchristii]